MVDSYFDTATGQTQPVDPGWYASLPKFQGPITAPVSQNTTGNLFTSALSSGFHQMLGQFGGAVQAGGTLAGAPGVSEWGREYAQSQREASQQAGRADLENNFWSPKGMLYGVTKSIPSMVGILGAGAAAAAGAEAAPVLGVGAGLARGIGMGLAAFPQAAGGEIEAAEQAGQQIDPHNAAKALLLGVPEAALMSWAPKQISETFEKGIAGTVRNRIWQGVKAVAPYNAAATAAQTAISQQAWTPDMSVGDRARGIVDAAMQGGIGGAIFGGVTGAMARPKVNENFPNGAIRAQIDKILYPEPAGPPRQEVLPETGPGITGEKLPLPAGVPAANIARPDLGQLLYGRPIGPGGAEEQIALNLRAPPGPIGTPPPPYTGRPVALLPPPDLQTRIAGLLMPPAEPTVSTPSRIAGLLEAGPHVGAFDQVVRGEPPSPPPSPEMAAALRLGEQPPPPGGVGGLPATVETPRLAGPPERTGPGLSGDAMAQVLYGKPPATPVDAVQAFAEGYRQPTPPAEPQLRLPPPPEQNVPPRAQPLRMFEKYSSDDLIKMRDQYRDANQLTSQQMGYLDGINAELERRTQPGVKTGEGNLLSPQEVTDTAQIVSDKRDNVLDRIEDPRDRANAAKSSFFKKFNAISEAEVINALKLQAQQYGKSPPKWFNALSEQYGLKPHIDETIDRIESDIRSQQAVLDTATETKHPGSIIAANQEIRRLQTELENAQQIKGWHDEAEAQLKGATTPPEAIPLGGEGTPPIEGGESAVPVAGAESVDVRQETRNGAPVGQGDAQGHAVAQEVASEQVPPATEHERFVQEHPEIAEALGFNTDTSKMEPLDEGTVSQQLQDRAAPRENEAQEVADAQAHGVPEAPTPAKEQGQPGWSQESAHTIGGDVIHEDGDHAIIRGYNKKTGAPQFSLASRALNVHTSGDFREGGTSWLTPGIKEKYAKIAEAFEKKDQQAYNQNPAGPWKGSNRQIVGDSTMSRSVVNYLSELMNSIGLGNLRVFLTHGALSDQDREVHGLNGPFGRPMSMGHDPTKTEGVAPFGKNNRDWAIQLKPGMTTAQTVQNLTHALGHIIEKVAIDNSSDALKASINQAYARFLKDTLGLKAQDLIRAARNTEMQLDQTGLTNADRQYLRSKSEFIADQVSRWASFDAQPRTALQKFYKGVAEKFRQLLTAVTGSKLVPDQAVSQFMNGMLENIRNGSIDLDGYWEKGPKTYETQYATSTVKGSDARVRSAVETAQDVFSKVAPKALDAGHAARGAIYAAHTLDGLVHRAVDTGHQMFTQAMTAIRNIITNRSAMEEGKGKAYDILTRPYFDLSPKMRAMVDNFMHMTQNADVNWRLPWSDHTHLQNLPDPERLRLQSFHQALRSEADRLRNFTNPDGTNAGLMGVVEGMIRGNQIGRFQALAAQLSDKHAGWLAKFPLDYKSVKGFEQIADSIYQYRPDLHDDPTGTLNFYKADVANKVSGLRDYVKGVRAAADDALAKSVPPDATEEEAAKIIKKGQPDYRKATDHLKEIDNFLDYVDQSSKEADKGTYLKLARGNGNYFASAKLKTGEDKRVDPVAAQALHDAMSKAGFENGVMFHSKDATVMSRVESPAKMEQLYNIFKDLESKGHLEVDQSKKGQVDQYQTMTGLGPKYLQDIIQSFHGMVKGVDLSDPVHRQMADDLLSRLTSTWTDMLPDHSTLPGTLRRSYASGASLEMGKIQAMEFANQARASSLLSQRAAMAEARQGLQTSIQDAKADPKVSPRHAAAIQQIANELQIREEQQTWHMPHTMWDTLQNWMHTIMIGANPAYVLAPMSQIPMWLHGELAKKNGFVNSAVAIGKATGRAFNITTAIMKGSDPWGVVVRQGDLQKAGIPAKDIDTIMKAVNSGAIGNNTLTFRNAELREGVDPSRTKIRNMANAMGLYAETFPRIVAALAAGDLYDKKPVAGMEREQYVHDITNGSQFNYGIGQTPRLISNKGPLGPFSRISLAFQHYHIQALQKLYKEVHGLLSTDAQTRKESGLFLASHMIAATALAGTLGLPAASFFAGAADRVIKYLTGRDDVDTIGLYRTWLSHVFGPDVADVVAKGLPRALGVDLSKLGEGNIIPFTGFMTEKRKFEDAQKDWLKSMSGSVVNEMGNLALGGRDMFNGDYMQGLIKVLPEGLKGLAEAGYLYEHGYVDKDGRRYPMQPGARDILAQALGLDPANLARYQEARKIQLGLEAQREYREQNITRHLALAMNTHDPESFQNWTQEALKYQREHPLMGMGPLGGLSRMMQQSLMQPAIARMIGAPLGVKPLDLGIRAATGFLPAGGSQ